MALVPLPIVESNCAAELADAVPAILARKRTPRGVLEACLNFRRMAIGRLLMSGLPDEFFQDLSRSARTFLYFLEGAPDDAKLTSRAVPYFDAVACGDDEAAARIAQAARPTFAPGRELEDDFLYIRFLMSWFSLRADAATLDALLAQWQQALAGADDPTDPRLDLCRALAARDQRGLDAALDAIVDAHRAEVKEQLDEERLLPEDVQTTAKVWVELLALLRLAGHARLATPHELPFAPSIARRLERAKLPAPDDWRAGPAPAS